MIKKNIREQVHKKYNGRCAYCGIPLVYKDMQVDHIRSKRNFYLPNDMPDYLPNDVINLNPACRRCNKWKDVYSLEQFRREIQEQLNRLKRDSSNYRMAFDFGMITENNAPVTFYFERTDIK